MKDIELAEKMVSNLEIFEKFPDWQDTVNMFRPMIEQIMEEDGCNAMKAAMPMLKKLKENNDQDSAQMLLAVVSNMILESAGV